MGEPPDSNLATDGTHIGFAYNATVDEAVLWTDNTGRRLYFSGTCGFAGFDGCSDPRIVFDRGTSRWIVTYMTYYNNGNPGGAVVLGVSTDTNIADGFTWYTLPSRTTGQIDQPNLGYTTDKVIVTLTYTDSSCHTYSTCDLVYAINKSQLYSLDGFNFDTYQVLGWHYYPISTPSYEGTILFEAPDFSTTDSGTVVTHYISGAEGSEVWTTRNWEVGNIPGGEYFAGQKGSSYFLDGGDRRFESAAYTGGLAWVAGNDTCSNGQLCPLFLYWTVNSSGLPTSVHPALLLQNVNGWDMYYPAIATTIGNTSVLGALDFSCSGSCGQYAGSEGFQLSTGGTFTAAGRMSGDSVIAPDTGLNYHRWGDYSGCDYNNGSSPPIITCVAQYASSGTDQMEAFRNQYS